MYFSATNEPWKSTKRARAFGLLLKASCNVVKASDFGNETSLRLHQQQRNQACTEEMLPNGGTLVKHFQCSRAPEVDLKAHCIAPHSEFSSHLSGLPKYSALPD